MHDDPLQCDGLTWLVGGMSAFLANSLKRQVFQSCLQPQASSVRAIVGNRRKNILQHSVIARARAVQSPLALT